MTSKAGFTPLAEWARKNARVRNEYLTEGIAEFIGTGILCLFCTGAGAESILKGPDSFMLPVFGGILGIMIAITVTAGSSGAHINPAVTLGIAIGGHLSWLKVPVYWACQLAGAYAGSGIAFGIYKVQLERHLHVTDLTSMPEITGIFAHYAGLQPNGFMGSGILDQAVATAILLMAIHAAGDRRNMGIPKWFMGLFFGLVVAGVNFAFGVLGGGSMNPARDIGPRLMAWTIGWTTDDAFMYPTCVCTPGPCVAAETDSCDPQNIEFRHYWLIPVAGPFIGAAVGTLIYVFLIGSHLRETEEELKQMKASENNNGGGYDWSTGNIAIPKAIISQSAYAQNGSVANGVANHAYISDGGKPHQLHN